MSATVARQGGRVQLEQSNIHLALNIGKMAKGEFLHAGIQQTQYLIEKGLAEVREEKKRVVGLPQHPKVKDATDRKSAMRCENHIDGCLLGQTSAANRLQTRWRFQSSGVPPPDGHQQLTQELTPPLPGMLPAPPGDNQRAESAQIDNLPPRYLCWHALLPNAQFFNLDAFAKDIQHEKAFIPHMLSDAWKSTG